ncbi:aminotransferase-like domain-containing protein [Pseudoalteromonas sp. S16_S37]|uniref:aminotransferase-like domain-containing protein n=1 Tax=Pseudoalteromonas sp. S16_S37 TaxID=2720228 RepID=UPI001680FEA6|nr:PLP-dependent aminotransferase family protein [Pseudoalteromonas sp. S16_S37]MBD1583748.1 PLP-dependent aminotransferase family protein [Pseudoalteromonas sp. S16_S37]
MSKIPAYQSLANTIIDDILGEQYTVGDALPSLRVFTQLQQVSMTTALNCYRYLEQQGYAVAKPKQGYFVTRPSRANGRYDFPSFTAQPAQPQNIRCDFVMPSQSFATAELDEQLIDKAGFQKCWQYIGKDRALTFGYADLRGEVKLREALCAHFIKQGFATSSEQLVITNGCLDAVLLAIETVSDKDDTILVSSPCYSGLLDMLNMLGRRVLEIPSTNEGLDLEQVELALKKQQVTACIITANHQNPTGHSLSTGQKQKLAALAEQYRTPIIEDDVFRELSHSPAIPLPIKHFDNSGWVLWCSSVSKTFAAGLRVGWCLPGRYFEQYITQRKVRTLGVNQPIQLALARYIQQGYYQQHIAKVNRQLVNQLEIYNQVLTHNLPVTCQAYMPTGGLVIWLSLGELNANEVSDLLAQQDIFVRSGIYFTTTNEYQNCIRINFGIVPTSETLAKLQRLVHIIKMQTITVL